MRNYDYEANDFEEEKVAVNIPLTEETSGINYSSITGMKPDVCIL